MSIKKEILKKPHILNFILQPRHTGEVSVPMVLVTNSIVSVLGCYLYSQQVFQTTLKKKIRWVLNVPQASFSHEPQTHTPIPPSLRECLLTFGRRIQSLGWDAMFIKETWRKSPQRQLFLLGSSPGPREEQLGPRLEYPTDILHSDSYNSSCFNFNSYWFSRFSFQRCMQSLYYHV